MLMLKTDLYSAIKSEDSEALKKQSMKNKQTNIVLDKNRTYNVYSVLILVVNCSLT